MIYWLIILGPHLMPYPFPFSISICYVLFFVVVYSECELKFEYTQFQMGTHNCHALVVKLKSFWLKLYQKWNEKIEDDDDE